MKLDHPPLDRRQGFHEPGDPMLRLIYFLEPLALKLTVLIQSKHRRGYRRVIKTLDAVVPPRQKVFRIAGIIGTMKYSWVAPNRPALRRPSPTKKIAASVSDHHVQFGDGWNSPSPAQLEPNVGDRVLCIAVRVAESTDGSLNEVHLMRVKNVG